MLQAVGDSGSLAICPQTGIVYGIVIAHDSDSLITYIVPIETLLQSVASHFHHEGSSFQNIFDFAPRSEQRSDEAFEMQDCATSNPVQPANEKFEATQLDTFLAKLKSWTFQNVHGQSFVLVVSLAEWLMERHRSGTTNLEILISIVYSDLLIAPVDSQVMSDPKQSALVTFGFLVGMGHGNLIHHFLRRGLIDSKMPFARPAIEQVCAAGDVQDHLALADYLFSAQWAFCPIILDRDMSRDFPSNAVLPFSSRFMINSKGATASVWSVTIPEQLVGARLRSTVASTRSDNSFDNLSYVSLTGGFYAYVAMH